LAALAAGHQVTLLLGEGASDAARAMLAGADIQVVPFVSVSDLRQGLEERFAQCDALIMAAAVGDFRPEKILPAKLRRRSGPITLRLFPTEDILAGVAAKKKGGQVVIAFAVEDAPPGQIEAKARAEMVDKNADYVVVNTPAAMGAQRSRACILSRDAFVLEWSDRPKETLARKIVKLLGK